MRAAVLDVIPYAQDQPVQLVPKRFGIVQGILLAAELDPPVAVFPIAVATRPLGEFVAPLEAGRPWRWGERLRRGPGTSLKEAGHPHRFRIGHLGGNGFPELRPGFAPHSPGRTGQRGQDAVP